MKSRVSIIKCNSYDRCQVNKAIRACLELLGGIGKFIRRGSRVLIKPNLLTASLPEKGITTHPEIVRAVIQILKEQNAQIILGDGPSVWMGVTENLQKVFQQTGMSEIAEEFKIKLVDFNNPRWKRNFPLTKHLDDVDALISLPKFKTHNLTILTGAIKNLFGLVPGTYKTELHKRYLKASDFSAMLADLYEEIKPTLSIVDGIVAMEGEGPGSSGKLRNLGLILSSSDAVAVDSVLAKIMGLRPDEIISTKEAAKRKLGVSDLREIEVLGQDIARLDIPPFRLPIKPVTHKIAQPVLDIAKNFVKFYPTIDKKLCNLCEVCLKTCPHKAITVKFEAIYVDYAKCASCFCCQEVCPNAAIRLNKSFLAKVLGF